MRPGSVRRQQNVGAAGVQGGCGFTKNLEFAAANGPALGNEAMPAAGR